MPSELWQFAAMVCIMEFTFSAIGISRLRMLNDGDGVTTLVAGFGCPLRCRYCLNPQCFAGKKPARTYTVQELLDEVRIDDLYFQATNGGVVFGGGEPLLQADFIHLFRQMCPQQWRLGLESSLAVPEDALRKVVKDLDFYLIDIKDMDPVIYRAYTGRGNDEVLANLRILAQEADPDRVVVRIPLIRGFNTQKDQQRSRNALKEMGFRRFDLFSYNVEVAEEKLQKVTESHRQDANA